MTLPTAHAPWIFFLIAVFCVLLIGVGKAGFGGGFVVLATPLLSLVTPPAVAAGILLPLLCVCDLFAIGHYRSVCDRRNLLYLLPGALLGVAGGSFFLWLCQGHSQTANRILSVALGVIALLFVLFQAGRAWLFAHLKPSRPRPWLGQSLGFAAGVTSTLAHAGAPPVLIFLLPQQLDRRLFVGTTVWFFTALNYAKLIPYYGLNLLPAANLALSLLLMPLVPVGVYLGIYLNRRVSQALFERVIYVILFLTGLQLVTGFNVIDFLAARR